MQIFVRTITGQVFVQHGSLAEAENSCRAVKDVHRVALTLPLLWHGGNQLC